MDVIITKLLHYGMKLKLNQYLQEYVASSAFVITLQGEVTRFKAFSIQEMQPTVVLVPRALAKDWTPSKENKVYIYKLIVNIQSKQRIKIKITQKSTIQHSIKSITYKSKVKNKTNLHSYRIARTLRARTGRTSSATMSCRGIWRSWSASRRSPMAGSQWRKSGSPSSRPRQQWSPSGWMDTSSTTHPGWTRNRCARWSLTSTGPLPSHSSLWRQLPSMASTDIEVKVSTGGTFRAQPAGVFGVGPVKVTRNTLTRKTLTRKTQLVCTNTYKIFTKIDKIICLKEILKFIHMSNSLLYKIISFCSATQYRLKFIYQ